MNKVNPRLILVREWYVFYHRAGGTALSLGIARQGLYLHGYDELFNKAKCLPRSDLKTAAIKEVSKLLCMLVAYIVAP